MIRMFTAILLFCAATTAQAQDAPEEHSFRIGNDAYYSGSAVTVTAAGLDTVFAAGETVTLGAPLTHSAHLAGRKVNVTADVAGDLYAAGGWVATTAPIKGSASLAGYEIAVNSAVGGNLRVAGAEIEVTGPVAGTAVLAGGSVAINGVIEGDTAVGTDDLSFGPGAKINGRLALYGEDASEVDVPATVISADRIDRHPDMHPAMAGMAPNWWAIAGGFVLGLIVVGLLAAIVSAFAPKGLEELRAITGERPLRTFFMGFLALSALLGSAIVLGVTVIGLVVAPAILLAALLLCALGYLIGLYLLGRMVLSRFGQLPPDTFLERLFTGLTGVVLLTILTFIPVLGWFAVYVLTLIGIGAFSVGVLRPEFRP